MDSYRRSQSRLNCRWRPSLISMLTRRPWWLLRCRNLWIESYGTEPVEYMNSKTHRLDPCWSRQSFQLLTSESLKNRKP